MDEKRFKHTKRVIGFQVIENECIWMKAGVVNFRLCNNVYDCNNCPFDKSMRKAMNKNVDIEFKRKRAEWAQNLHKRYDGKDLPCRHALTGRIDAPKICALDYECYHCAYDQWLDDYDVSELGNRPSYKNASGYMVADGYYYHEGHAWACFEHGGRVRVGFDDFVVKLFGVMDKIELPSLGEDLKQGFQGWMFRRDDHVATVLSPVSGKVLAVNHKSLDYPVIAHEDPYHAGWLCILESDLPLKDAKRLYSSAESVKWIDTEIRNLLQLIGPEYEELAALGGEPIGDVFGNFPALGWNRLTKKFLKT
jgi:glycine cleavage system H lipoate-binding protein